MKAAWSKARGRKVLGSRFSAQRLSRSGAHAYRESFARSAGFSASAEGLRCISACYRCLTTAHQAYLGRGLRVAIYSTATLWDDNGLLVTILS